MIESAFGPTNPSRARLRDVGVTGGSVVLYAHSRGGRGVVVYCLTPQFREVSVFTP
jgi:hypothetical protein